MFDEITILLFLKNLLSLRQVFIKPQSFKCIQPDQKYKCDLEQCKIRSYYIDLTANRSAMYDNTF